VVHPEISICLTIRDHRAADTGLTQQLFGECAVHAYRRRSETVPVSPIRLWVESATSCNLRCVMCCNKDLRADEKKVMDFELFRKIVDEAGHFVNDMYLHHRGEPLMNKHLFEMIAYARNAGIKTRFHTNGTLLGPEEARKLLDAGPNLVSFSIDGFDKESYEAVRIGADFEETVENVVRLAELKKINRQKRPYVVVERIRFRDGAGENAEAVAGLRKRFLDAGVDEVIEKDEYVWATEDAPEAEGPPTGSCCTFPWYAMVICADGTVTPCPQDFGAKMNLGNVGDADLEDIWNAEPYRELRRQLSSDVPSLPLCHKCDRLRRKTIGGVPFQYTATFLIDQLVGYNRLRKMLGTAER
jgi:radical SAM protein with 4Fe4S-binding SPASM domain